MTTPTQQTITLEENLPDQSFAELLEGIPGEQYDEIPANVITESWGQGRSYIKSIDSLPGYPPHRITSFNRGDRTYIMWRHPTVLLQLPTDGDERVIRSLLISKSTRYLCKQDQESNQKKNEMGVFVQFLTGLSGDGKGYSYSLEANMKSFDFSWGIDLDTDMPWVQQYTKSLNLKIDKHWYAFPGTLQPVRVFYPKIEIDGVDNSVYVVSSLPYPFEAPTSRVTRFKTINNK